MESLRVQIQDQTKEYEYWRDYLFHHPTLTRNSVSPALAKLIAFADDC